MRKMFTVGETAKFLGVSAETLRHYDRIGLLEPSYVDEETGYRYYSFDKFHYIDRIKYLQSFGLGLPEITEIIHSGDVDRLVEFLERQIDKQKERLEEIKDIINDMEWYKKYFTYFDNDLVKQRVYRIALPERYILKVPCYDEILSNMEFRLARKKAEVKNLNLSYRRQYGYIIDYDKFCENIFMPTDYFIYLRNNPNIQRDYFDILPAGDYLCTTMKILTKDWCSDLINEYFTSYKPSIVLAMEHETNLVEYSKADYEIQFYLG